MPPARSSQDADVLLFADVIAALHVERLERALQTSGAHPQQDFGGGSVLFFFKAIIY